MSRPPPAVCAGGLTVTYPGGVTALDGIDLEVEAGSSLAIVGESGCGKTTMARVALGICPRGTRVSGSLRIGGHELVGISSRRRRRLAGEVLGYVGQDPYGSAHPLWSVGRNIAESWAAKGRPVPHDAIERSVEALGVEGAAAALGSRPHQWSGGMLQRASVVAAVGLDPDVLIADEPTSALDAHLADEVIGLMLAAAPTLVVISHDLQLMARHCDRIAVLYAGRIVEIGASDEVLRAARHPYTRALIAARPRPGHSLPRPLPGQPPNLAVEVQGCRFAPRCPLVEPTCHTIDPVLRNGVACHVVGRS